VAADIWPPQTCLSDSSPASCCQILVLPTDEELSIAQQTVDVIAAASSSTAAA
jgi:acetate kinase